MTNEWRPEGWDNPMLTTELADGSLFYGHDYGVFEAGASAMLEALRNYEPLPFIPDAKITISNGHPVEAEINGKWVFIPDDK